MQKENDNSQKLKMSISTNTAWVVNFLMFPIIVHHLVCCLHLFLWENKWKLKPWEIEVYKETFRQMPDWDYHNQHN